jgi:hypothetical protein
MSRNLSCINTIKDLRSFIRQNKNNKTKIKNFLDKHGNDLYLLASIYGQLEIMKYLETKYDWNISVTNYKKQKRMLFMQK